MARSHANHPPPDRQLPLRHGIVERLAAAGIRLGGILRVGSRYAVARPNHPFHWFGLTLSGHGRWRCREGGSLRAGRTRRGSVLIFPRSVPYWLEAERGGWEFAWFSLAEQSRPGLAHAAFAADPAQAHELRTAVEAVLREAASPRPHAQRAAALHAELVAIHLRRLIGDGVGTGILPVTDLAEAIARQPGARWSVARIAASLGVSERQAHRLVRRLHRCTPAALVLRSRMRAAEDMLRDTALGLRGIARTIGYADAFSFAKAFARHAGTSPGRWRQRSRT